MQQEAVFNEKAQMNPLYSAKSPAPNDIQLTKVNKAKQPDRVIFPSLVDGDKNRAVRRVNIDLPLFR